MKAFVREGIGKVGFMEKPIPNEVGPNDAIIKTTRALVCTSDVHTVKGAIGNRKNLTLGHEAVGIVYKLGSQVQDFREGDRVAVNAITPCYTCDNCLRGVLFSMWATPRRLEVCQHQGWELRRVLSRECRRRESSPHPRFRVGR